MQPLGETKMKFAVVNSKELFDKKKNPTLCLSVCRALTNCQNCRIFQKAFSNSREHNLKCDPQLKPEVKKLLLKRRRLTKKHVKDAEKIRQQIKQLE